MIIAAFDGFLLGASLIMAIGAQNAFVIRQGILRQYVLWICLFCAVSDAVLIWIGVFGLSLVTTTLPLFIPIMTYGGAAFLIWFGYSAFRRALKPDGLFLGALLGGSKLSAGYNASWTSTARRRARTAR